ncbi:MAG TPA: DMT family transporter [Candidatus Limnocylindrales bacterium]
MSAESAVAFGLASAVTWGSSDFAGGLTSRRSPVFTVGLIVQFVGGVLAAGLAVVTREVWPGVETLGVAAVAGVFGASGILFLYHGLAVGRMGVVAPVTGVLAATLPVAVGMVRNGLPPTPVVVGIGVALVAVILVSRVPGIDAARSGIEFGIAAGLTIGGFNVLVGQFPAGQVFAPLIVVKLTASVVVLAIILIRRPPWRIGRADLPTILGIALVDMAGNTFFVLAAQAGRLDVAATLSSLYPVTTVVLAATVLRERMTRIHLAGILAAGVAIALIASGSAAG